MMKIWQSSHSRTDLHALNQNFRKRKGKLWIYTNPNITKAQLDFIFIENKCVNNALNSVIVLFWRSTFRRQNRLKKIHLSLFKYKKQTGKSLRYDWFSVSNAIALR